MKILDFLGPEHIIADLAATTKQEALTKIAAKAVEARPGLSLERVLEVLAEREGLGSTGIGDGVAIPHGKISELDRLFIAIGRSSDGVPFESVDRRPVHLLFLILAPENAATLYLKILARVSRLLKTPEVRQKLLEAADTDAILQTIEAMDDQF